MDFIARNLPRPQIIELKARSFESPARSNRGVLGYNFGRIHQTLRVTPAMAAGLSDHVWSIEEIVKLLDTPHREPIVFM
jgi:hypothetical protein